MKLHEIITTFEGGTSSVLTELLHPYKKSLLTYYKAYYNCEPVLMVTDVFNACSYAMVVPGNEFSEAIYHYLAADEGLTDEEKEQQTELISFQSIMLKDF